MTGKGCPFCESLAGTWKYGEEPKEIYARHDNCTCVVTYDCAKGQQNVHTKQWQNRAKNDTIDKIIKIDKGVGAAAKNAYNVELPDGRHAKLAAGTIVTKIVVIAGEGTKTPVRVAEYLEDEFGHKAKDWKKVRGEGYIRDGGKNIKVELHWFEANGDRVRMKVKRKLK